MDTPTPERHDPFSETITLLGLLVPFLLTLMYGSRTDFLEALLFSLLPTLFLQTLPLLLWLRNVRRWPLRFRLPAPLLAVLANGAMLLCTDFSAEAINGLIFIAAPLFLLLPTLFLILGSHCAHHACAKTNRL